MCLMLSFIIYEQSTLVNRFNIYLTRITLTDMKIRYLCVKMFLRCHMIFDGFFLHHLINELNQELTKARLEKIYQTSDMSFVFIFYLKGKRMQLKIDLSPHRFGMNLTETKAETTVNSQFLQTIRKHLEGSILEEIVQHETDRVANFMFTVYDYIDGPIPKKLVFEAMGKHSNLILVKDDVIIETYKKMFFEEGRQLIPSAHFEYFPSHKKPFTHIDYKHVESAKDLMDQYMGVSPLLAAYLFEHKVQIEDILMKPTKSLKTHRGYVADIFDEPIKKHYDSISLLIDDHQIEGQQNKTSHELFIDKQYVKYQKRLEQLESYDQDADQMLEMKYLGDLIYQSGYVLDEKMSEITVDGKAILLDPLLTLNENAQRFYNLYQKAKRTKVHVEKQIEETLALIQLFLEYKTYIQLSDKEHLKDLEVELIEHGYKPKQKQNIKRGVHKPNITKIQDAKAIYYIGRNSVQNAYVTHQLANKDDYWFHVKDAPGGHIVVACDGLNEEIIRKAAMLAAYHSSLKLSSSIPVDYTQVKNVKKIPGTPGYQVTYSYHKTIFIDIDEEKIESYFKKV
ncbi:MAG: fibronectin-binding domain-containing protein [Bacillota bacterium]|nr:MAG: fibronectin-binding domain-containing protein [Bacillota bacterium]